MKNTLLLIGLFFIALVSKAQNVGINTTTPTENLHVDSTIKIGKNTALNASLYPTRKNLLKFGDNSYVTIGEEVTDDKLYVRYGDLIFLKSSGSAGNGYIGVGTETPTATFDLNGSFRFRTGAAAGSVLTSDANGNASWVAPASNMQSGVYSIGSYAFQPQSSSNDLYRSQGQGGAYYSSGITSGLGAPVILPNGVTVTSVTFWFRDNSTNDLSLVFGYENLNAGNFGFLVSTGTSGISTDWRSVTVIPQAPIVINNNTQAYYVQAYGTWTGTYDLAIKGVVINYTYASGN